MKEKIYEGGGDGCDVEGFLVRNLGWLFRVKGSLWGQFRKIFCSWINMPNLSGFRYRMTHKSDIGMNFVVMIHC